MGENYISQVLELWRTENGMPLTVYMYSVFYLLITTFSDFDRYKFQAHEAHFHSELIGTSPMIIACNSGKLFALLPGYLM